MNRVQEYLNEYKAACQSNDDNWENFLDKHRDLAQKTQDYFKGNFKFLPENHTLDFHDSYVVGNVRPNMNEDSFNLTIRMLCYEKLEDTSAKHPYRETDPVYVDFTIDNKFRSDFHKLAVKSSGVLAVVYEEQNLGITYLTEEGKLKALYVENIDLSQAKSVEQKVSKKLRM